MADSLRGLNPLNCKNSTPIIKDPKQQATDVKTLLKRMGADQECVSKLTNGSNWGSTSGAMFGEAKAGPGGFLGKASFGGNFQSSQGGIIDTKEHSGCGTLIADASDIITSMNRINCSLSETTNEVGASGNARASVRIEVDASPEAAILLKEERDSLTQLMRENNEWIAKATTDSAIRSLTEQNKDHSAALKALADSVGVIEIRGSVITVDANVKVKTISQNVDTHIQKTKEDVKKVARSAAMSKLTQTAGVNAKTENVKQLVQRKVDDRSTDIENMMKRNMLQTKIKSNATGEIILSSYKKIAITNTRLTATSIIDQATSSMVTASIDIGKEIAKDILMEVETKSEVSTAHAGLEAQIKAMGDANEAAIETQMEGITDLAKTLTSSSWILYVVIGVAVVTVGGIAGSVLGKKSGGQDVYEYDEYDEYGEHDEYGEEGGYNEYDEEGGYDEYDEEGEYDEKGEGFRTTDSRMMDPQTLIQSKFPKKLRGAFHSLVFGRGRGRKRGRGSRKGARSRESSSRMSFPKNRPSMPNNLPSRTSVANNLRSRMSFPKKLSRPKLPLGSDSSCTLVSTALNVGRIVLLVMAVQHGRKIYKPIGKMLKGDVKGSLTLLNPFGGLTLSFKSILNIANPLKTSDALAQALLKLYVTLCLLDVLCKFPYKLFMPYLWWVPANPISVLLCMKNIPIM